jgi:hypothetical protein
MLSTLSFITLLLSSFVTMTRNEGRKTQKGPSNTETSNNNGKGKGKVVPVL